MASVKIRTIKKLDGQFLRQWHRLWQESSRVHYFNSPQCFIAFLETFGPKDYFILAAFKNGQIWAICPLVASKKFGIKVLTSPGGKFLDKLPLLLKEADGEVVRELILWLKAQGNFSLDEVEEDICQTMLEQFPEIEIELASVNPFLSLPPDPLRFLYGEHKRKLWQKIEKEGQNLSFELYRRDAQKHLETMLAIEGQSSKKRQRKDIFSYSPLRRTLLDNFLRFSPDQATVALLYHQDVSIAYSFGFLSRGTYHFYQTAYLADYSHLTPGKILLFFLMSQLHQEGIEIFDFGRSDKRLARADSEIKLHFAPHFAKQYNLYFAKNPLVRAWWKTASKLMDLVERNQLVYEVLRRTKRFSLSLLRQSRMGGV